MFRDLRAVTFPTLPAAHQPRADRAVEWAAWPSGLERWCCNPDVPGSTSPPSLASPRFNNSTLSSGICFSEVPSSNRRSRFVNTQPVYLLSVGIFNYVTFIWNICSLFQWHACKLATLSACIAKRMTTINKIYILHFYKLGLAKESSLKESVSYV